MHTDIFADILKFTCNGDTLPLNEIAQKKITSITIGYLSSMEKVKLSGLKGLFGIKKSVQHEREITITDPVGITLYTIEGNECVTIRFWEKKEFEKLQEGSYDESTIWKRYVMAVVHPYQINFHIGNLKKIAWQ